MVTIARTLLPRRLVPMSFPSIARLLTSPAIVARHDRRVLVERRGCVRDLDRTGRGWRGQGEMTDAGLDFLDVVRPLLPVSRKRESEMPRVEPEAFSFGLST